MDYAELNWVIRWLRLELESRCDLISVRGLPHTIDSCGFCGFYEHWASTSHVRSVCGVLWIAGSRWRSNNVITMDSLSYDLSALIDWAPRTRKQAGKVMSMHGVNRLFYFHDWPNVIRSPTQATPSRQAPVPSCQVIRAPPPWPLTLPTGRPTPAVCRWLSFGLHMLTMVNHHMPQPAISFLALSLSVSGAHLISSKTQAALYFYLSHGAPVQSPGGLFLSLSLLPPMASCSISVPLLLAVLLALSYMHLIFPVLHLSSTHACHTLL